MWSVPPPSIQEARKIHDVGDIEYCPSDFGETVEKIVKGFKGGVVHTLPDSDLWPKIPGGYAQRLRESAANGLTVTDAYLLPALQQTRLQKDAEEIELIRRANAVSSRAHEVVMRVLGMAVKGKIGGQAAQDRPPLPGEWLIEKEAEAEALFVASCRREGYIFAILNVILLDTDCELSDFEVQFIKPISLLSHLLLAPRHCTTAATTRNLRGVLSNQMTITTVTTWLTRMARMLRIRRSSTHKCSLLMRGVSGTITLLISPAQCLLGMEASLHQKLRPSTSLC